MGQFSKDAAKLRDQFRKLADVLDQHYANVNTAKLVGGGFMAYGGAVTVAGVLLAPFTAGSSLFVAGVGGAFGALGGATYEGADYVGECIEVSELKGIEESWDEFRKKYAGLLDLDLPDEAIKNQAELLFGATKMAAKTYKRIKSMMRDFRSARAPARYLLDGLGQHAAVRLGKRAASAGMSVVGFALSVKDFIDTSVEIHSGNKSKAGQALRKMADELDQIAQMNI